MNESVHRPGQRLDMSVIVPAFQCAPMLASCLSGLRASSMPREAWEIIVVDDGSNDDTLSVARRFADHVIPLAHGPHGPAYARNTGALLARGDVLLFVDADVVVHPSTPRGFLALFQRDPTLAAAYGAYDAAPVDPGFISQYRNLLHHFVHAQNAGTSTTFWAGCGAVRREIFLAAGGFDDDRYSTPPAVEDIELGYRFFDSGYRIQLVPELQATHLKRWTFAGMVVTDLRARAIPWMHLLLDRNEVGAEGTLNVQRRDKLLVALSALATMLLVASIVSGRASWIAAATLLLLALPLFDLPLLLAFCRERGFLFALRVIPLRTLFYLIGAAGAAWAIVTHRPGRTRRRPLHAPDGTHVVA